MKTLKEAWKIFCRGLYANVLQMEKNSEKEIEESFRLDKPYSDRKRLLNKIKTCEEYKKKIVSSVKDRQFCIQEGDDRIIEELGFDYYFRYVDCYL